MAENETLDVAGVAEYLHCGEGVVTDLISDGEIPATRLGRGWVIPRSELAAWFINRATAEAAERRALAAALRPRTTDLPAMPPPRRGRRRAIPALGDMT